MQRKRNLEGFSKKTSINTNLKKIPLVKVILLERKQQKKKNILNSTTKNFLV